MSRFCDLAQNTSSELAMKPRENRPRLYEQDQAVIVMASSAKLAKMI